MEEKAIPQEQALVSVIMPCYNDGKYIEESISSIFAQTYPTIELVIINDGTDDADTLSILGNISDVRIRIIKTPHLRPAGARNAGIRVARGKYILPLDADDLIEPSYIEKAVKLIEAEESTGVVYCMADKFGEQNEPWPLPKFCIEEMLRDNIVFVTALFYRADWEAIGGFREDMIYGMEDYDFWLSLLEMGRDIRQIEEVLFHYRIKPRSRTSTFLEDKEKVKDTYRQIYFNHHALYQRYADLYALELRNMNIDMIYKFHVVEAQHRQILPLLVFREKLKKIPGLRAVVNLFRDLRNPEKKELAQ